MFKLVVLSCVLTFAVASPSLISPIGLGLAAPLSAPLISPWAAPIATHGVAVAAPVLAAPNYRGPLSLAPGQPANILASDGRPLDTLSVNLDRAAHITAKALDHAGLHLLKKRSAPLLGAPLALPGVLPAAHWAAPAPLALHASALHAPITPWGLQPLAHGAPLVGHLG